MLFLVLRGKNANISLYEGTANTQRAENGISCWHVLLGSCHRNLILERRKLGPGTDRSHHNDLCDLTVKYSNALDRISTYCYKVYFVVHLSSVTQIKHESESTINIYLMLLLQFFLKVSNRSFKNKAGYYLIEEDNHSVTGTKSLSKCQNRGMLVNFFKKN